MLKVKFLNVKLPDTTQLVDSISLEFNPGEIHLIMGPNGAGKSTFVKALMGIGEYAVTGSIKLDNSEISKMALNDRNLKGLYLAHQQPIDIPGVKYLDFLRTSYNLRQKDEDKLDPWSFSEIFEVFANRLGLPEDMHTRNLNEGFSGGERKKAEILQMLILEPKYALLDEIDSGLDLEALKTVFTQVQKFADERNAGVVIISHNPNILEYITPDYVHLMVAGQITKSAGPELVKEIVAKGYAYTD